jgi:RNA polymerase sigma-70 factor (ECF subfamily)
MMCNHPQPLRIFEVLAKQHEAMLLAYVRSLVQDYTLAEDIAQQSFLIAFRKIESLRDPAAFPAWLRNIARLETFAAMRREGRELAVEPLALEQLDEIYQQLQEQKPTESWEERFQLVEECFGRLPATLQTVCRMHYFEDRKAREIADTLTLNLNAVLKRLERARSAIRACVQQRLAGESI